MSAEKKIETTEVNNIKLQLLGELAGGIVHEINGPLSSISLYAERIESLLADFKDEKSYNPSASIDEESIRSTTKSIAQEVERIGQVINSINHFSKPQSSSTFSLADLTRILDEMKHLCNHLLVKNNVKLTISDKQTILRNDARVEVNYSLLIHALVNLVKNSCEALERNNIENRWIKIFYLISDSKLVILLQDSGPKESDEIQQHYFEPGFTRKKNGTGLGLNLSKNLLESFEGKLEVVPNNETTTMRITLNIKNE